MTGAHCISDISKINKMEILCGYNKEKSKSFEIKKSETGFSILYNQNNFNHHSSIETYEIPSSYIENHSTNNDIMKLYLQSPIRLKQSEYIRFQSSENYLNYRNLKKVPELCLIAGYGLTRQQTIGDLNFGTIKITELTNEQLYQLTSVTFLTQSTESNQIINKYLELKGKTNELTTDSPEYNELKERNYINTILGSVKLIV